MTGDFDMRAMREWADVPLPSDRDRWPALVNQVRADIEYCCDRIEELEAELARLRGAS